MRRSLSRHRVFLSHSSHDSWVATQIARHIRRCGTQTFLYEVDTEAGDDIEPRLAKALRECTELLVLLTPWSLERRYVWMEIGAAWVQEKRITAILYPMTFDELSRQANVPGLVKRTAVLNINEIDKYFEQLRARIARKDR